MSEASPKFLFPNVNAPGFDILIVSDDRAFIDHHRAILLSIGFVPIAASTVEAALTVLGMRIIELVIVDEAGRIEETQRFLKQVQNDGQAPVLVVSPNFDPELRRQALALGAAEYLDRPAFQDDVVRVLLDFCSRRKISAWGPQQN